MSSGIASTSPGNQPKNTEGVNDWAVIGWTFGLVALGFLVYRPWQPVPFDITDFSEMLPLFSGSDTSLGRLDAVLSYYLGMVEATS